MSAGTVAWRRGPITSGTLPAVTSRAGDCQARHRATKADHLAGAAAAGERENLAQNRTPDQQQQQRTFARETF